MATTSKTTNKSAADETASAPWATNAYADLVKSSGAAASAPAGSAASSSGNAAADFSTPTGAAAAPAAASGSSGTSGRYYKVGADGKAPAGLSVGDQVVTGGGTYLITGLKDGGGYTSSKASDTTTANFSGTYSSAPNSGSSGRYYKVGADGKAPKGLSVGDQVVTYGGTYIITGVNSDGTYTSSKASNTTVDNFSGKYSTAPANGGYNSAYEMLLASTSSPSDGAAEQLAGIRSELENYAADTGAQFDEAFWSDLVSDTRNSYEDIRASMKAAMDAQLQSTLDEYAAQRDELNRNYDDLNRQMYIEQQQGQKNLAQVLAAQGISGGATESSALKLSNAYASNLAANERGRSSDVGALERAMSAARLSAASTKAEMDAEITQAALTAVNNLQLASRSEKLDIYQIQQQAQQFKLQMEASLAQWEQEYALSEAQYKADVAQMAYSDLSNKAETLATYGDFSGYSALGYTSDEISRMKAAYDAALVGSSGGGGGGSSGSGYRTGSSASADYVVATPTAKTVDSPQKTLSANPTLAEIYRYTGGNPTAYQQLAKQKGYSDKQIVAYDYSVNGLSR